MFNPGWRSGMSLRDRELMRSADDVVLRVVRPGRVRCAGWTPAAVAAARRAERRRLAAGLARAGVVRRVDGRAAGQGGRGSARRATV